MGRQGSLKLADLVGKRITTRRKDYDPVEIQTTAGLLRVVPYNRPQGG